MRIAILGGRNEADYVIRAFNNSKNYLTVINNDPKTSRFLSESNGIDVLTSNPTRLYTYETVNIRDYDLVIALMETDVENFVACQMAKKLFNVKRAICTVNNPDNVKIFTELGIDSPISGSFLLTERIEEESDVESLFRTMKLENEKVTIVEFRVKKEHFCAGKAIKNLGLPAIGNICCVYRNPEVIIPRGDTIIKRGDRLILACAPKDQEELKNFLRKTKDEK